MKYLLTILSVVLLSTFFNKAEATHIVGGEMTYTCMGAGDVPGTTKYRVRLDIYQDCLTGAADAIRDDNPAYFSIFDGNNNRYLFNGFPFDSVYAASSVFVPRNFNNSCVNNPPVTCLKKQTYISDYSLPNNSTGYKVVYQRCCRNGSIVNIVDPGRVGATYSCTIPPLNQVAVCNNSAIFTNYPPQIICINNPLIYDHSATDADGDSLSYEFCVAYRGGSDSAAKPIPTAPPHIPVNYAGSFNAAKPMAGNPLVQINPSTGLISGTPNIIGRFVVTVCCHEWRNGVMINTVTREFQFVVTNCSKAVVANIPQFSTEPNTYIVECKSRTVKFINNSTGGFEYHWDFGVEGIDNDTSAEFEPTFTYPDTGTYFVKLIVNKGSTCPDSISRAVKVYPVFSTDYSYSGLQCPGDPISFIDSSKATYKPVTEWNWSFGDGNTSFDQNPVHIYPQGGYYSVTLISKSIKGCVDTMIKELTIENFQPRAGEDTVIVKGEYIRFNASGGIQYAWTPGTWLNTTNVNNPIGFYPDTTRLTYNVHITSAFGCQGDDSINVWVVSQASVFVPSAFTPNGDGLNDILRPIGIGFRNINFFRVFNRFGQVVYFSNRFKIGWDGTFNGAPCDMNTYFWELNLTDRFGKTQMVKGDVTLVR